MRITGGTYLGRKVQCPPGIIRPAMDRMRTSLFSILGSLEGYRCVDMFSGSGLVGIEMASRGASYVALVESDRKKFKTLAQNISFVEEEMKIFAMPVQQFLKRYRGEAFDLIYADPPFPLEGKEALIDSISKSGLLAPHGLCIIHYPKEERWKKDVGNFVLVDQREYGRSVLKFFRHRAWVEGNA